MSNINVNTITPLAGTSGTVSVSGSLLVSGNITAQGNLTFGDQDTDSVSFGAEISSSIIPDANLTYNLGSATKRWSTIHVATGSFNHIVTSGSTGLTITSASISYLAGPTSVATNLIPDITNTFDIGSTTLQWKDLYIDGNANLDTLTNVSGAAPTNYNVQVSASLVPAVNTIWDLGTSTKEWKDLYIDGTAFLDTIGNQTNDVSVSSSLTPNATATYAFGTTAKQWKHIAGVSASFSHKIGIGSTIDPAEALTVVGNISASGHISASSVGAAVQLTSPTASFGITPSVTTNTAGNVIYAHGNISASGATMASTASFGAPASITTNPAGTNLYIHGAASASGLISAQTMSIANGQVESGMQLSIIGNASASGHISASQIGAASIIGTNITASTNISTSAATSKLTVPSASITYRLGVGTSVNPAEALFVEGNASASGTGSFLGLGVNTALAYVVPGTISGSGYNINSTTITGLSGSFGHVAGTLDTAAQGNITSVGILTSVSSTSASIGTTLSNTTNIAGTTLYVHGAASASGEIEGASLTAATISGSNVLSGLTASFGITPSVGTNPAGNVLYAHGNISASGTIFGDHVETTTADVNSQLFALTASIGAPVSNTTNVAGVPLYVHGNISASGTITAGGVINSNVVEQSGTAAEDLTAVAQNVVWYSNAAQAGDITLPQATVTNVGMVIKIIVGTTNWSGTAFKLGYANGGSTVMTGYIRVGSNAGSETVDGFVVTADAKHLVIDADAVDRAGGAIGSTYTFTYLEANLVHVEANGQITTGTPAIDAGAALTSGI